MRPEAPRSRLGPKQHGAADKDRGPEQGLSVPLAVHCVCIRQAVTLCLQLDWCTHVTISKTPSKPKVSHLPCPHGWLANDMLLSPAHAPASEFHSDSTDPRAHTTPAHSLPRRARAAEGAGVGDAQAPRDPGRGTPEGEEGPGGEGGHAGSVPRHGWVAVLGVCVCGCAWRRGLAPPYSRDGVPCACVRLCVCAHTCVRDFLLLLGRRSTVCVLLSAPQAGRCS
jgi:hypothetical protein